MIAGPGGFEGPYDEVEFLDRVEGDRELAEEIIQLFLDQCTQTLPDIREALNSGDLGLLSRLAHSVKGSVGIFGARDSVAAALGLETAAGEGDRAAAKAAWVRLEMEIQRLTAALQEKVGGTAPCDF